MFKLLSKKPMQLMQLGKKNIRKKGGWGEFVILNNILCNVNAKYTLCKCRRVKLKHGSKIPCIR